MKKIFYILIVSIMFFMPFLAFAQTGGATPTKPSVSNEPVNGDDGGFVPCGNEAGNPCTIDHLFRGFIVIINYLIAMAGFVAVVAIVYSGLMMVWSQGDDGAGLKDAKSRLSGAIIGLILVAVAYVIVNSLMNGSLSLGVCNGNLILSSPIEYIKADSCS